MRSVPALLVLIAEEDGRPLRDAHVTVRAAGDTVTLARTTSDADGRFLVRGLVTGRYVLAVSSLGCTVQLVDVTVAADVSDAGGSGRARIAAPPDIPGVGLLDSFGFREYVPGSSSVARASAHPPRAIFLYRSSGTK